MLQNAPHDAQNIKVWNSLIQETMQAKKYKLAFKMYTDLKRRGFIPNQRTFNTMMTGYGSIQDWKQYTKIFEHVTAVYENAKAHLDQYRKDPEMWQRSRVHDPDLVLYPIALYIEILGDVGLHQKAFDVFHDLDADGIFAPNAKIFEKVLAAIAKRETLPHDGDVAAQNISDTKYFWRRLSKLMEQNPDAKVDSRVLESAFSVLAKGGKSEHALILSIFHEFCGLPVDGDRLRPRVELNRYAYDQILRACNIIKQHDLCISYGDRLLDGPDASEFRSYHAAQILYARHSLATAGDDTQAAHALRLLERTLAVPSGAQPPTPSTLAVAFNITSVCRDWNTAVKLVELLTGMPLVESARAGVEEVEHTQVVWKGGKPWKFHPQPRVWCYLFRTALSTRRPENAHQCLQLFHTYGQEIVTNWSATARAVKRSDNASEAEVKAVAVTLPALVITAVDVALSQDKVDSVSRVTWLAMRSEAKRSEKSVKDAPKRHRPPRSQPLQSSHI
ncbi:hypothetical protein FA95DRAFT_1600783 [Auriscalpium vulgare]|uniref:Uncharacterized protein n=1 Tax=Auriscalpium vulgare TaxID=40419 RepID=A0ACB8SAZ2_9AGAM|nr:hypothetical protein FA95DRAFT_1600783 [Auriscalpium vulgare]